MLFNKVSQDFKIESEIPKCCKIALNGQQPPLNVSVRIHKEGTKKLNLRLYYSFKETEPSESGPDVHVVEQSKLRKFAIPGDKMVKSVKQFSSGFLYLNFKSLTGVSITVNCSFPELQE